MSWKAKAAAFIKQVGPAAKFAATTALSVMVPGSPAVIELVEQVLDCATDSADQVWQVEKDGNTAPDLERVGRLLEDMQATMDTTLAQLAALDGLPDAARRIMDVALANDVKLRDAGNKLQTLVAGFDRLELQLGDLANRQEMAIDQQHEMLTWQRLSVGLMLTFYSENTRDPRRREQFRAALAAFGAGRLNDAHPALTALAAELPASAAVHGALGAVQATEHDLPAAQASLVKAARLNPADPALQQLSSKATVALTRLTPSAPSPDVPLHVGDLLGGWEVIQLLGSGGWGQVVKGRKAGQVAALKVLHAHLSRDEMFQADFRKEMMALMRLGGMRHLAEILDFGFCQQQRRWFFVMAFVEGMSLQTHLDRHGPLPLEAAVACFRPLAEALGKAHALNIVHRDIKPANLLRGADGSLTLVDFGLAGAASARGTLEYAAPEQLRGRPANARSDVYSLAATLYKVVTGDDPDCFQHDRIKARALAELLALSLKANPKERPANAGEFATGLQLGLQTGQQHGEALLAQGYRDALDRNHGDQTKGDKAALAQLCRDHGISRERANVIVRKVKAKWDEAAGMQEPRPPREATPIAKAASPTVSYTIAEAGITMRLIKPGRFWMGSPANEKGHDKDETQHEVVLTKPYYLAAHPVTHGQFRGFIEAANYRTEAERQGGAYTWTGSEWKLDPKYNWRNPGFKQEDDHPVVCVSHNDAVAYCEWLNRVTRQMYGLPTEAQWEYACRGRALSSGGVEITSDAYHFGKAITPKNANYSHSKIGGTSKVASYPCNGFGLYDMHGNVWEWCGDWYGEYLTTQGGETDPQGPSGGSDRVFRGGSWSFHASDCRAAYRRRRAPSHRRRDLGFRLARVPSGS